MVIGGSSAYHIDKELFGKVLWKKRIDTPFGLSSPVYLIETDGVEYFFLSRHGEKDYEISAPFVNYRANIFCAKVLGVERILAWTGPGTLREEIKPGSFAIPKDVVDLTSRKNTFFEGTGIGFIRQNPVFCPQVMSVVKEVLKELQVEFYEGCVYACTQGPRLETCSEVKFLKLANVDLVGMTLCPEVFLAKELEMCYGAICYITNYAECIKELDLKPGVLFEGMLPEEEKEKVERAVSLFPEIVKRVVKRLNGLNRNCHCNKSLERFKMSGRIKGNPVDFILGG